MNNWPLYLRLPYWKQGTVAAANMEEASRRTIDQLVAESGPVNGRDRYSRDGTNRYRQRHPVEFSPLLPLGLMMVICTVVFIMIVFRRWPGLVAGIIAGCLTSVSIYLILLALRDQRLVYE